MSEMKDANSANIVLSRGEEQALAWLNPDGSADFGTVAANGATNFLHSSVPSAVAFINNCKVQGYGTVRYDERWAAAETERSVGGQRRRQALVSFRDDSHGDKTFSIFEQGDEYMCLTIENGEPSTFIGTLPQAVANLFEIIKPGWEVVRVSPDFAGKLSA